MASCWVLALWDLHTYAIDAAEESPYLAISAPLKRSGKTHLRDALRHLVRLPWSIDAAPTEPVLYRKIAASEPTILLDEADGQHASDPALVALRC